MDFLSEIIAIKKQRLAAAKARFPLEQTRERGRAHAARRARRFSDAFRSYQGIRLIAEFKRRSPSKGKINAQVEPATMARIYEAAGAAAISVLTEEDYFDGSLDDLRQVRENTTLPILRKDFIFDEYQVYESAWADVDALLLIAAALDDDTLARLRAITEDELQMTALVEVHTKVEMDRAVRCGARVIGVNNRDLHTFNVSIQTSELLARAAPHDVILISESGLTPETVRQLAGAGYRGFLVGEALMRAADPAAAVREYIEEPQVSQPRPAVWVKICGITNLEDARAAVKAGADMLGFNFYRPSPRFVEPRVAGEIVKAIRVEAARQQRPVSMIGVFVNETLEQVCETAAYADLDGVQLHGDETPEYCQALKHRSPQKIIIKVLGRDAKGVGGKPNGYQPDAWMVDALHPNLRGGTGRLADWEAARASAREHGRLFLAGGLSPENVGEAIAAVRPYAVDVCSSVESGPGKKSAELMRKFVEAVRTSTLPDERAEGA